MAGITTLSTFCWPSVTVRRRTSVIVSWKIVKAECTELSEIYCWKWIANMLINPWRKSLPRKTNVSSSCSQNSTRSSCYFCAISMVTICDIIWQWQNRRVTSVLQYYSATLVHFPPVCYWCGAAEEILIHDSIFTEKERNFQTVHAICMFCRSEGELEFTRHPLNAPKHKKT